MRCFLQNVILYSGNLLASMSDRSAMEMKPYPVTTATRSASKNVNEARTVTASISKVQSAQKRIGAISVPWTFKMRCIKIWLCGPNDVLREWMEGYKLQFAHGVLNK